MKIDPLKLAAFRIRHSVKQYGSTDVHDRDLAREICELIGVKDYNFEEVLTKALKTHRYLET